jgi:hypothetical protein
VFHERKLPTATASSPWPTPESTMQRRTEPPDIGLHESPSTPTTSSKKSTTTYSAEHDPGADHLIGLSNRGQATIHAIEID